MMRRRRASKTIIRSFAEDLLNEEAIFERIVEELFEKVLVEICNGKHFPFMVQPSLVEGEFMELKK